MPIYEYECGSCQAAFEQLVRSADSAEPAACPECGSRKVRRRLSVFAAHQGGASSRPTMPTACARCGDPAGSCALRDSM